MTKKQLKSFSKFNPKYSFELFVQGPGNQLAYDSAMAVANNPSDTYNPLFIYGGVGLGKTHLLNSIGLSIRDNSPELDVCYCSVEKFMYEMVNHLRLKKMNEFRKHFRNVDVLLVDDIQFISGKSGTQEEFFHTLNALYEAHKQIVIASGRFPHEISDLDKGLRSRFGWGLIVDIQPPDLATKTAILHKISAVKNISIPDDVINVLAASYTYDIRELEGMLIKLDAYSRLKKLPITMEMANENLKYILSGKPGAL